jgi:hypothetical protein
MHSLHICDCIGAGAPLGHANAASVMTPLLELTPELEPELLPAKPEPLPLPEPELPPLPELLPVAPELPLMTPELLLPGFASPPPSLSPPVGAIAPPQAASTAHTTRPPPRETRIEFSVALEAASCRGFAPPGTSTS